MLVNEELKAGAYAATFDGDNLASGMYFYRSTSSGQSITKRLTLMK